MKKIVFLSACAASLVLSAFVSNHEANASQAVHPDCADNDHPVVCTGIVETLEAEVEDFRQEYMGGDLDQMASFYGPSAIVQVFGQFYRGKESITNDLLAHSFTSVEWELDTQWQVISPDVVVQYGPVTGYAVLPNGYTTILSQHVIVTWIRNPGDQERPFVIASGYYEVF